MVAPIPTVVFVIGQFAASIALTKFCCKNTITCSCAFPGMIWNKTCSSVKVALEPLCLFAEVAEFLSARDQRSGDCECICMLTFASTAKW